MRGPVGGAVGAGAMAQMHGKLFVEGAVWGEAVWGAVGAGAMALMHGGTVVGAVWGLWPSIVGKLLGGTTHVAGLLPSFIGELCGGTVCVGAVAGSSGGLETLYPQL